MENPQWARVSNNNKKTHKSSMEFRTNISANSEDDLGQVP